MKKIILSSFLIGILISGGCSATKNVSQESQATASEVQTAEVAATSTDQVASAVSSAAAGASEHIRTVSPDQFSQLLLLDDVQVLDVRTAEEYKGGHIKEAVNIDVQKEDFETKAAKLDKEKPVMVYCRSGKRSDKAANTLESMGFKKIINLEGGMLSWEKENKPVEK